MRQLILLFAASISATAYTAEDTPLAPFGFLAGHCWRGEFQDSNSTDTHCYTWVYGGKHLRDVHVVSGDGPDYRGETIYSVDGASGDVIFRYWNSLGGVSDGRVEFEGGAILAPETYMGDDGQPREFRNSLRRLDETSYETQTEELVGNEWTGFSRVTFTRIGAATDTGPAARQQSDKLAAFAAFIGEWLPAPDDAVLEQRPDMRGKVAHALEWGPRRMHLRVLENYPSGNPDEAVAQGFVYWDHLDQAFNFAMSTAYGWTFEGKYRLPGNGSLERTYDVHYRDGEEYIPVPEMGGQLRRFRETYVLETSDSIKATLEIFRDGAWQPFGPGEYAMVRR
jgi:hypothetical protein